MTQREHERTRLDSSIRAAEAEDLIVKVIDRHPYPLCLALAGAIAHGAVANMDYELLAFAQGPKPIRYPIFERELRLVETLGREHTATPDLAHEARSILDQLLRNATCDEVALGALKAARYYYSKRPAHLRQHD